MLKLIKYELIGSYRQYLLSYLVFLMACIVVPLLPGDMGEFLSGFLMLAVLGIFISLYLNIIIAFKNSMYKQSGYLTLTLPVSSEELLLSKVIGSFIWMSVAVIVLMIGISIIVLSLANASLGDLWQTLGHIGNGLLVNMPEVIKELVIFTTSMLTLILSLYFTVSIVNTRFIPKYKTFIGIAGYFAVSIAFGLLVDTPIISNFMLSLDGNGYFMVVCAVNIVMILGFFYGTKYLIDKQIEVE